MRPICHNNGCVVDAHTLEIYVAHLAVLFGDGEMQAEHRTDVTKGEEEVFAVNVGITAELCLCGEVIPATDGGDIGVVPCLGDVARATFIAGTEGIGFNTKTGQHTFGVEGTSRFGAVLLVKNGMKTRGVEFDVFDAVLVVVGSKAGGIIIPVKCFANDEVGGMRCGKLLVVTVAHCDVEKLRVVGLCNGNGICPATARHRAPTLPLRSGNNLKFLIGIIDLFVRTTDEHKRDEHEGGKEGKEVTHG